MFWLKCCPRCGGALYDGMDIYGRYIACLQCGHYLTPQQEVALVRISRGSAMMGSEMAGPPPAKRASR